jgi:hypothetical protein
VEPCCNLSVIIKFQDLGAVGGGVGLPYNKEMFTRETKYSVYPYYMYTLYAARRYYIEVLVGPTSLVLNLVLQKTASKCFAGSRGISILNLVCG